MTLRDFILEHADDDVAGLLLSRGKWPGIDIDKAATIIECRRKIRTKLPEWYAEPEIIYQDRICAEQSSSSATAEYKALVAKDICSENPSFRMADLTGGLGADSLAFSRVASAVMYNEMNPDRAEAAGHNFGVLGSHNIEVSCFAWSLSRPGRLRFGTGCVHSGLTSYIWILQGAQPQAARCSCWKIAAPTS